ncbi:cysteine proteinase [Rhizopogon salebrosus TDB-379]|nr:cysteine proteinase [Rhizopogon salebrosus TDB-379]
MGPSKKHQRRAKAPLPRTSRTTRSKGRPIGDPEHNTQLLTEQLRSLGLYAAHTVGDGNCLFRALCDQFYGSPSQHLQLRKDICDWIESYAQRYEPFCEDERGLSAHLRCMREQGTYGGHLELSAFAHFARRNVKVIQPGLVYVIEWKAGAEIDDQSSSQDNERDARRRKRQQQRDETMHDLQEPGATIYVAYHDWEHFSSIRNLRGPHTGLPEVCELPADAAPPPPSPAKKKPVSRAKPKPAPNIVLKNNPIINSNLENVPPTPAYIPLPLSRSPSPLSSSDSLSTGSESLLPIPGQSIAARRSLSSPVRIHRSPKRSFDESSGSSTSNETSKRTRSSRRSPSRTPLSHAEADEDMGDSTPDLSAPGSPADSVLSSSTASSPLPGTPPAYNTPPPEPERPLTRRQRKALGLPKSRMSAGKITIPGGRYKNTPAPATAKAKAEEDEEWQRNGTGRLDVRGFRELKI